MGIAKGRKIDNLYTFIRRTLYITRENERHLFLFQKYIHVRKPQLFTQKNDKNIYCPGVFAAEPRASGPLYISAIVIPSIKLTSFW